MKHVTLISLALASTLSFAQGARQMPFVPRNFTSFVEKPGSMEFTGRMLARPLQADAWARLGVDGQGAAFNRELALAKISDVTLGLIGPIDVFITSIPKGFTENTYARELMKTGLFEYVEPDFRVYPQFTPNDPQLVNQWSHTDNNSTNAWDIMRGNSAITIAITDTGVHITHEDLLSRRVPGANSATATSIANVKTEAGSGQSWIWDLNGHGTHCTGIAAADGNNGLGVAGVNIEGTKHMMVRVSDSAGGGSSFSALSIAALYAGSVGCRVVSTSYSGVQQSIVGTTGTTMKNTYNAVYCYAAGNDGGNYGSSVDWPDVTIVGSIDLGDNKSSFSAYGLFTDVFAPGGNIVSTYWTSNSQTNTYAFLSGTSMATPYAAGVAAMIAGQNPSYSAQRIENILYRSSINMQNNSASFGWGRVNLWNAMGRVANNATVSIGGLVSGSVASLYRVDGANMVVSRGFAPTFGSPRMQVETEHNVPAYANNNYGEIDVMTTLGMSTANASFQQQAQIWNFTTGAWETIGTATVDGGPREFVKVLSAATWANYISAGVVRVRTQVFQIGFVPTFAYQAKLDQINVRTLRLTE